MKSITAIACVYVLFITADVYNAQRFQRFETYFNITTLDGVGPVIQITCTLTPLPDEQLHEFRWFWQTYSGGMLTSSVLLAQNGVLSDETPTRYMLSTIDNNTEIFSVRNAVKEDGDGLFACQAVYSFGLFPTAYELNTLKIHDFEYLPGIHHPVCNIITGGTKAIPSGSEVEFTCTRGDSNPEVNLQLNLRKPDGSVRQLGTNNVTVLVFSEDNNASFTCKMTSDTFPTANRSCSAGPLTILPAATEALTPSSLNSGETKRTSFQLTTNKHQNFATSNHPPLRTPECPPFLAEATGGINMIIAAVVPIVVVAFISILTNIYLLTNNYKLKKTLVALQTKKDNSHLIDANGPYMELQKTQQIPPGAQDYMDLQQTQKSNLGASPGYENVKKDNEQLSTFDSPYESVE